MDTSGTASAAASGPSPMESGASSIRAISDFPVSLIEEIEEFIGPCDRNYRFNSRADTLLSLAGLALSVGIVVAGVFNQASYATIAIMTAAVSVQRAFPFSQRWQFYRTLRSQAQNLATKAKSGTIAVDQAVQSMSSLRLDFAQQIPRGSIAPADPNLGKSQPARGADDQ